MSNCVTLLVVRPFVIFATMFSLLLAPIAIASSPDSMELAFAEAGRHAQMSVQVLDENHIHDDGAAQEESPGHVHNPSAEDPAHEPLGLPAQPAVMLGWDAKNADYSEPISIVATHARRIEQPPSSLVSSKSRLRACGGLFNEMGDSGERTTNCERPIYKP